MSNSTKETSASRSRPSLKTLTAEDMRSRKILFRSQSQPTSLTNWQRSIQQAERAKVPSRLISNHRARQISQDFGAALWASFAGNLMARLSAPLIQIKWWWTGLPPRRYSLSASKTGTAFLALAWFELVIAC